MSRPDEIRARLEAATEGPWEPGEVFLHAGVLPERYGPGRCAFCHLGAPVWEGVRDINGVLMEAHRHRTPEPLGTDYLISGPHGSMVAGGFAGDGGGGILRVEDVQFVVGARADVPDLLAVVESAVAWFHSIGATQTPAEADLALALLPFLAGGSPDDSA